MRLLHRNAVRRRAAAQLLHKGGLDVTHEEPRPGGTALALIVSVK
jgi:hypothetical protein